MIVATYQQARANEFSTAPGLTITGIDLTVAEDSSIAEIWVEADGLATTFHYVSVGCC